MRGSEDSGSPGLSACAASISCTRLLYTIFLVAIASLFAEGWEPPSVSGTHPSVTTVQVCLVSCVWPHPDYHHQHLPHGSWEDLHLPSRCPTGPLPTEHPPPAATTSWE